MEGLMELYCINRTISSNPTAIKLLKKACDSQGVEFHMVDSKSYNFAKPLLLEAGSILYQISADERSRSIFRTLLNDDVATVFMSTKDAIDYKDKIATVIHQKAGLPIIKTIFDLTSNKELLKEYVEYLGGFPIIIKAQGGSHGVGVIRADSIESLGSIADYLLKQIPNYFVMRQYIDYVDQARLIVLNGKVIDSIKYHRVENDFRSNSGRKLKVEPKKFSKKTEDIAIKAVEALNAEFGGVDILIDKDGENYLAEVNVPCFFPRAQLTTGHDTAGDLVKFLKNKAEKLL
jgi:glutathione synthase/RimK-type ligase-like ATP-grasp enzyme